MTFNRIAVYAHRGWASSAIAGALAQSGAPVKILYRPGSNTNGLPGTFTAVEVNLEDQQTLIAALIDIDIVISLVGREDIEKQHALIKAIPHTNVKLFVPSDLAFRCDEMSSLVHVNRVKDEVERAAREAGIPTTVILPGCFAESGLNTGLLGVDVAGNRIIFSGNSENQKSTFCTREYVAAGYASIFATTPIAALQDKPAIGLAEVQATGAEVASALEKKHGSPPQIYRHSLEEVEGQVKRSFEEGLPLGLAWYCRRAWGIGQLATGLGEVYEIPGYQKKTLNDLIVKGLLAPYRDFGPEVRAIVNKTFY
ncbi:NmrA-like family protein [Penicillium macrosclerotiorum]|uniref:NmrA-like family protein n=1 Tax=Penicillium macrosclerotiorum TaxID=303699 RepID=UPI002547FF74|nr:NmrA-like family protein [Penicillium macrosclerotiorum]KAJ5698111.1 NmrA-like family protein [Penicillium macrosclerotiorum]